MLNLGIRLGQRKEQHLRLKQLRLGARLSQLELAAAADVSRFTIAHIERWLGIPEESRHIADRATQERIARVFGISNLDEIDEFSEMKALAIRKSADTT